ncbi:MAG: hypothetical protein WC264_01800 [Candidatus Paceibacterota bacterium]|jgi:hypothetical protein
MENKTIFIIVNQNKNLIDKLLKIAHDNDFQILGNTVTFVKGATLQQKIDSTCDYLLGYSSKLLKFDKTEEDEYEIDFLRFLPENWRNKKILNGNKKKELDQAITWIKAKKSPQ